MTDSKPLYVEIPIDWHDEMLEYKEISGKDLAYQTRESLREYFKQHAMKVKTEIDFNIGGKK